MQLFPYFLFNSATQNPVPITINSTTTKPDTRSQTPLSKPPKSIPMENKQNLRQISNRTSICTQPNPTQKTKLQRAQAPSHASLLPHHAPSFTHHSISLFAQPHDALIYCTLSDVTQSPYQTPYLKHARRSCWSIGKFWSGMILEIPIPSPLSAPHTPPPPPIPSPNLPLPPLSQPPASPSRNQTSLPTRPLHSITIPTFPILLFPPSSSSSCSSYRTDPSFTPFLPSPQTTPAPTQYL